MTSILSREFLAQAAIVLAMCVGGWMMLVQPKMARLAEMEATIAGQESSTEAMDQRAIERMADEIGELRAKLTDVRRRSVLGGESSKLYGMIMDLAESHDVAVDSLQPGSKAEADKDDPVSRARIEMTIEGQYEQVASFLRALKDIDAFIRPSSMTLTPRQDAGRSFVVARLNCEALSFAVPEALASMGGSPDAEH